MVLLTNEAVRMEQVTEVYGEGKTRLMVATGSPGELGLLKAISELFVRDNDAAIAWVKAGTGRSLSLLKTCRADLALVHVPLEKQSIVFVDTGLKRSIIGGNEFYLVGPTHDPAQVRYAHSIEDAYSRIAESHSPFISRGDDSGTHQTEMAIWHRTKYHPRGDWYLISHDFMTATLLLANLRSAYFMLDSSTWAVEKLRASNLSLLYRGDYTLLNPYYVFIRNSQTSEEEKLAKKFKTFLTSMRGQQLIGAFGCDVFNAPLYHGASFIRNQLEP
ncbi:MAG: substrate-binding domain-containing protein [Pseudomonadota bacterium]|nr:substrate-binding domain-containing protein [Pseudomonadota bacterium]